MKLKMKTPLIAGAILCALTAQSAFAAIALDRTRVVYNGSQKSISLNVSNENKQLPYLAQGWIEDAQGNKITSPLAVLPPVQRIEPGAKSQVKVQGLPAAAQLPQDRESLFYFNLREIPPRTDKPNTLQIALQTRIKMFYRPEPLEIMSGDTPWQEQITLTKQGGKYMVNNPTPYFITLVDAKASAKGESAKEFQPWMVEPNGQSLMPAGVRSLGNSPVLTYIKDYGARPQLQFSCKASSCVATPANSSH